MRANVTSFTVRDVAGEQESCDLDKNVNDVSASSPYIMTSYRYMISTF